MCHKSGKGYVEEQKGAYYDALRCKKSRVIPFIVETLGGITPHAVAYVGQLARRADGRGARDSTKYGTSRTSARSYFRHHIQRIAMAAKLGDANAILLTLTKTSSAAASLCYRARAATRLWGPRRLQCSDMRMGLARPDTDHE